VALIDDHRGLRQRGHVPRRRRRAGFGEVYQVYVDPACWGRGIGSNLLGHVVRDLHQHGFDRAVLWLIPGNASARAFAEKHGWRADGSTRFEDCGGAQVELARYQHTLR
jgi:GNAT superfamily N-acetyltransferase